MPTETNDQGAGGRAGERIAKLLARAGIASRREVERMIAGRRVALNGVALDTPATVLTSLHGVTVDGRPVSAPAPARLFLYHKPSGLLVTERDPAGRPTIYDRLPADLPRVVPVGRLDLATEGLLLLTTDGGVKRQLELPATGVERTYRARTYGDISQARLEELIDGIEIDGIRYGSIDANMERRTGANGWIELTLTEGKNREVRRVLEHLGLQVSRLIRTRYGPFVLGELKPGEVGEVRQADLVGFRRQLDARKPRTEDRVAVAPRTAPVAKPAPTTEPDRPLRHRPARPATPKPAKQSAGWGTKARPSRPTTVAHRDGDRETLHTRRPRGEDERLPPATGAPRRSRDGGGPSPIAGARARQGGTPAASDRDTRARVQSPRTTDARTRGADGRRGAGPAGGSVTGRRGTDDGPRPSRDAPRPGGRSGPRAPGPRKPR